MDSRVVARVLTSKRQVEIDQFAAARCAFTGPVTCGGSAEFRLQSLTGRRGCGRRWRPCHPCRHATSNAHPTAVASPACADPNHYIVTEAETRSSSRSLRSCPSDASAATISQPMAACRRLCRSEYFVARSFCRRTVSKVRERLAAAGPRSHHRHIRAGFAQPSASRSATTLSKAGGLSRSVLMS